MPKFFLLILLFLQMLTLPAKASAQAEAFDVQISRLDREIAQAAAEHNYEAVAGLQRDKDNMVAMKRAIESNDVAAMMALQGTLQHPYDYQPGQTSTALEEQQGETGPEFYNQVYSMDAAGNYQQLEKNETSTSSNGGGYGGFGGSTSSVKIPGSTSNVRFKKGQTKFVVKVYAGQDPSDVIKLARFDIRGRKKDRFIDLSKSSHAMYSHNTNEVTDNRIRIAFKNVGDHVYEIQIDPKDIEPGEYGFLNGDKVFAFGLDE
ncbi:MAG: hypothetical protein IPO60_03515 [Flavobacteriales bacterium]|nr:hypothetical protein [Flavobacteriales bacterium]MBK6892236.1 hypothetical protein [Flavobacteriales bacterium]MBK7246367.1 hypothetical protein [Flavobacteriales bacterium]MBK7286042.1 hypothetical protein [Flavobacteriales bacterium]MBK9597408.1 hypothetical protein [Flavobacteriales bacterium]